MNEKDELALGIWINIFFKILVCNIRSAGPVADGFFVSLLFESFRQFSCELNWKFRCYLKKNKIHISQVIGFQSTLRIIAFAKKNSTGTQKLAENTLRGDGGIWRRKHQKQSGEFWLRGHTRLPEILLSKVCRVDIDVQQSTWTH